jgi:RimJ/RimL family protein N-acetyltransferase
VDKQPASGDSFQLRDGSTARLRAVRQDDTDRLIALFHRLSPESVYYRFLEPRRHLPRSQAELFANVDHQSTMAIAAALPRDGDEDIIGVARYALIEPPGDGVAEAAIVVEDAYQGQGLGTELLQRLANYASSHGLRAFRATIHQSNSRILHFIERSGLRATRRLDGSLWDILIELPKASEG